MQFSREGGDREWATTRREPGSEREGKLTRRPHALFFWLFFCEFFILEIEYFIFNFIWKF
jgi:hypothetical protein